MLDGEVTEFYVNKKTERSKAPKRTRAEKRPKTEKRPDANLRPKETTGSDATEKRRSPRYPSDRAWSNGTRERHRKGRDQAIEDAGLVTDRMVEKERKSDQKPKKSD